MSLSRAEIIAKHPIGGRLDEFRDLYSICQPLFENDESVSGSDVKTRVFNFLVAFTTLPACHELPSPKGPGALYLDILRFAASFELSTLLSLMKVVYDGESDIVIWGEVYDAVTESTPQPRPLPSFQHTPWSRNTGSSVNSSEYRSDMDHLLKEELGEMYVDIPGFYEALFGEVTELSHAEAVLERCKEGANPLYLDNDGWTGWPEGAKEAPVLHWLVETINKIKQFFEEVAPEKSIRRRPLAQPYQPLYGSKANRKLDIGFMDERDPSEHERYAWSQIFVPGELKSNPNCDTQTSTWLDLGRYVREVLAAQDSRLFVPGFTLCGSRMRLWHFDRLGGIASKSFDIHKDGLQFVLVMLTYLILDKERLGFDPTIISADDSRYIEIERDGKKEHLIIDDVIKRTTCVSGRATTCWKAHRREDKSFLVVKDSWQYPERGEEGELLRESTEKGVVNVARYYHHETVQINDKDYDICDGARRGLDIIMASNYKNRPPLSRSGSSKERSSRASSRKRSSTCIDPMLPPSKRAQSYPTLNRVQRRVIIQDYGKPIYLASSRVALLSALEECIIGYESLYSQTGMLQRDISPNNLIINEEGSTSWKAFIIDLDLAVKENREEASGARGKTGTRAFMAIGILLGEEQHSFMHDLESFFWVLFWICIHYEGPGKGRVVKEYEEWNYMSTEKLGKLKLGTVAKESIFIQAVSTNFTPYFEPLIPFINNLREVVFPADKPWEKEDRQLFHKMKMVLQNAQADSVVLGDS